MNYEGGKLSWSVSSCFSSAPWFSLLRLEGRRTWWDERSAVRISELDGCFFLNWRLASCSSLIDQSRGWLGMSTSAGIIYLFTLPFIYLFSVLNFKYVFVWSFNKFSILIKKKVFHLSPILYYYTFALCVSTVLNAPLRKVVSSISLLPFIPLAL